MKDRSEPEVTSTTTTTSVIRLTKEQVIDAVRASLGGEWCHAKISFDCCANNIWECVVTLVTQDVKTK